MKEWKDKLIKEMDLINAQDIKKMTKDDSSYILGKIRKIRLLMFLEGYAVPPGYISKSFYKKYYQKTICFKKYKKEDIDFYLKTAFTR